ALLEFNQSVVVSRKDPESRRKAVTQIKERLNSNGLWPQPVLLSYPNKQDTMRWTYKGTSWLATLWHTTSQIYTNVTVEYLPVYTPSEEEKADPQLYADNVQKLMARSLGLPATDYMMEGRVPVHKLGGLSLPVEPPAKGALGLLRRDRVGVAETLAALSGVLEACHSGARPWKLESKELAAILGLGDDTVDLRHLYLGLTATSGLVAFKSLLHEAFNMYDPDGRGYLPAEALSGLMGALLGATQHDTAQLYTTAARDHRLTEEDLLSVLTTHPTYQMVVNEYLKLEKAGSPAPDSASADEKAVNNNGNMSNGNTAFSSNKKAD
ncbi:hypothetical protein CRUP_004379, partial [Coryphaenoides rupestris]